MTEKLEWTSMSAQPVPDVPARPLHAHVVVSTWTPPRVRTVLDKRAWPAVAYGSSRLLVFVLATLVAVVAHRGLVTQLTGFDGSWYLRLAEHGYPSHVIHGKSTLGFLPGYPVAIRALSFLLGSSYAVAALVISFLGGLLATYLVQLLAEGWWGEAVARRAVVAFVVFPGSVVFSMAYSECITIPCVLGCLLALRSRRFVLAGCCAAVATSVEPIAVVLVIVCALVAVSEVRRSWPERAAFRSLLAPCLAPLGLGLFAVYLWAHTGSPFATLTAQHYGWYEQTNPLGIFGQPIVRHLISHPGKVMRYLPSWNLWSDIAGAVFLVASLVLLLRLRGELSRGSLAWPVGVGLMACWSVMTPPGPRMLIVAVPAVIVWARYLRSRWFATFVTIEVVAFCLLTLLTLSGHMLP